MRNELYANFHYRLQIMPGFLAAFGVAVMAAVMLVLLITRLPFGIGPMASLIIVVAFWLLVAHGLFSILHYTTTLWV